MFCSPDPPSPQHLSHLWAQGLRMCVCVIWFLLSYLLWIIFQPARRQYNSYHMAYMQGHIIFILYLALPSPLKFYICRQQPGDKLMCNFRYAASPENCASGVRQASNPEGSLGFSPTQPKYASTWKSTKSHLISNQHQSLTFRKRPENYCNHNGTTKTNHTGWHPQGLLIERRRERRPRWGRCENSRTAVSAETGEGEKWGLSKGTVSNPSAISDALIIPSPRRHTHDDARH